jgi:AraC family ethanolamine operon transcriptional activator
MSFPLLSESTSPESDVARGEGFAFCLKTHDFDQLATALQRWDHRFQQLSGGRFDGEVHVVRVGDFQMTRFSVNQVIQARGIHPSESYLFVPVSATNASAVWRGRTLKPGPVVVLSPGQEHDHLTSRTETILDLNIAASRLHRIARVSLGCELEDLLAGKFALGAESAAGDELQAAWLHVMERVESRPELLCHPRARSILEEMCTWWVVRILKLGLRGNRVEKDRLPNPLRVVRRVEEYMLAHLREPLTLVDFCQEAGVSERTLLYAFHEVLGMSPKAYLKVKRLNAVRQDLKAAEPDGATVAEIAGSWGFWHTGNFAADYFRLFGQRPSQTRRR